MPSLPRLTAWNAGLSLPAAPAMARVESPAGGSTLITRAPMSDSNIAQYGPAITWVASTTTMLSSSFAWDITGSLGILTFTRPEARNALTWEMYEALERACDAVDQQDGLRVLIIRGSGGAFSFAQDPGGRTIITYQGARFFGVTPAMTDASLRLEAMDRVGIDVEVLSLSTPNVYFVEGKSQLDVAKLVNDGYAELIARYPKRFKGFASIPMDAGDAALDFLNALFHGLDFRKIGTPQAGFSGKGGKRGAAHSCQVLPESSERSRSASRRPWTTAA